MDAAKLYDAIVIGGGPAGLTAALYLARARYRVLVVEKETFGGQITITSEVVNYPGVAKTSGRELTETMRRQAESFGAEFLLAEVNGLDLTGDVKTVRTEKGDYQAFGVLLATGAHPRMVGFPGESEFRGRGVAYCATCDGEFFRGKEVYVVGGGFAAAEESVFLTRYASHVTVLIRGAGFKCAEATAEGALKHPKITVLTHTEVVEATGASSLQSIRVRNRETGEERTFGGKGEAIGLFVFAGYTPETDLVRGLVELTDAGYIVTDREQKTSLEGVYAAGDVCVKNLRQVVTAVGDGAIAATELEKYAAHLQKKTGLVPKKPEAPKPAAKAGPKAAAKESALFSPEIVAQLGAVFARMASPLILELSLDERPVSRELKAYMEELARHTEKLTIREGYEKEHTPLVRVLRGDGTPTGLAFHGVPGGHEFTSFILGLYNAAGPGQPIGAEEKQRAAQLKGTKMQIFVSLSCTMCPELVTAAQRIAALNPGVTAEVYDLAHFQELRDKYNVMSVPCLVINEKEVTFGKKNLRELLSILEKA